jgi:hypothetical protein
LKGQPATKKNTGERRQWAFLRGVMLYGVFVLWREVLKLLQFSCFY